MRHASRMQFATSLCSDSLLRTTTCGFRDRHPTRTLPALTAEDSLAKIARCWSESTSRILTLQDDISLVYGETGVTKIDDETASFIASCAAANRGAVRRLA